MFTHHRVQNSEGLHVSVPLVHIHIHSMTGREVSRAMFKDYLTRIAFSLTAGLQSQKNQKTLEWQRINRPLRFALQARPVILKLIHRLNSVNGKKSKAALTPQINFNYEIIRFYICMCEALWLHLSKLLHLFFIFFVIASIGAPCCWACVSYWFWASVNAA